MRVSGRSDAREQSRVVSASVINTQPVLEIRVSTWVGRPAFRILSTAETEYTTFA